MGNTQTAESNETKLDDNDDESNNQHISINQNEQAIDYEESNESQNDQNTQSINQESSQTDANFYKEAYHRLKIKKEHLVCQNLSLQEEISILNAQINVLDEKLANKRDLDQQITNLTNELNVLQTEYEHASKLLEEENEKNKQLFESNGRLAKENILKIQLESHYCSIKEESTLLKQNILESNEQIIVKTKQLANLQDEFEALKQRCANSEQFTSQINDLVAANDKLTKDNFELKSQNKENLISLSDCSKKLNQVEESLVQERKAAEEEILCLYSTIDDFKQLNIEKTKQENEKLNSLVEVLNNKSVDQAFCNTDLIERINKLEIELKELKENSKIEIVDYVYDIQKLEKANEEYDLKQTRLDQDLKASKQEITRLTNELKDSNTAKLNLQLKESQLKNEILKLQTQLNNVNVVVKSDIKSEKVNMSQSPVSKSLANKINENNATQNHKKTLLDFKKSNQQNTNPKRKIVDEVIDLTSDADDEIPKKKLDDLFSDESDDKYIIAKKKKKMPFKSNGVNKSASKRPKKK